MTSLYEALATPVQSCAPRGSTLETKTIETIDDDQVSTAGVLFGTRETASVETIDDDVTLCIVESLPGRSTTITATIETTDEDSALFGWP